MKGRRWGEAEEASGTAAEESEAERRLADGG